MVSQKGSLRLSMSPLVPFPRHGTQYYDGLNLTREFAIELHRFAVGENKTERSSRKRVSLRQPRWLDYMRDRRLPLKSAKTQHHGRRLNQDTVVLLSSMAARLLK